MNSRVFITGGSGFIGESLIRALSEHHDVIALVRSEDAAATVEAAGAQAVHGDLFNTGQLTEMMRGCQTVYHLAGINGWDLPPQEVGEMWNVNGLGTQIVCEAMRRAEVKRLVYISSVTAISQKSVTGTSDFRGSAYGHTKLFAETVVQNLGPEGPEVIIVRPASVQGRRLGGTAKIMLAMAKGSLPVFVQSRFYLVSIDDCVRGIIAAGERGTPGGIYTLTADSYTTEELYLQLELALGTRIKRARILPGWLALSLAKVITWTCHRTGRKATPMGTEKVQAMLRDNADFLCDRAREELNWHPEPTQAWLTRAIDWYRQEGLL